MHCQLLIVNLFSMFLKYNIAGIVWAIVVMVLCGIPGNDLPELTFLDWLQPDKIVHILMFGPLCFLLIKGFSKQESFAALRNNPKTYAAVITILYGILTEVLQATIFIGRTGDPRDAAADAIGAFCGIWFFNFLARRKSISA